MLDINQPISGKTYSLFGNYISTNYFYERIRSVTDRILLEEEMSESQLLTLIQKRSFNRRELTKLTLLEGYGSPISRIIHRMHDSFQENITGLEEHLQSLPFYKRLTDKVLFTSREEYYLFMAEFELVNRIHLELFLNASYRIALLPYCLRETQVNCQATVEEVDYQCRGCMKSCFINHVSRILKENLVQPYIWRNAKLKPLFRELSKQHGRIGVLGIACLAELVAGMRKCMKAQLPVVGIPLNANRCPRWTNHFYETSVDLNALQNLLNRSNS